MSSKLIELLIMFTLLVKAVSNLDSGDFAIVSCGDENELSNSSTLKLETSCPPWMYYNNTIGHGACECIDIPYRAVLCDPTIPRTFILDCFCMTFNPKNNETELGHCIYGCGHKIDTVYYELPQNKSDLNEYTCANTNRDSTLCGACKSGYSPLVYSFELKCMNCTGKSHNWIKYVAVAYIPLTFFFLFIVVFKFSGTSPLLRGFISICQVIVSPISMRAYLSVAMKKTSTTGTGIKVLGSIYGIWNLDFFRTVYPPICLDITPLQALALDYAVAFYPLVLSAITLTLISLHSHDVRIIVWLWKPFHKVFLKRDWDLERSVVKALATFFLLSYFKFLNVTTDFLVFTKIYTQPFGEKRYKVKHALYYDASAEYFKNEHLYYGIAAIIVGTLFVILPLVFLVIYPMRWFQKCLNMLKIQRQSIDIFVDCYQGYYKDGTNGTRDYRFFSVTFFFLLLIYIVSFTLSRSIFSLSLVALATVLCMYTVLVIQPYKKQFRCYNVIDASMMLFIGIGFIILVAADEVDVKASYFSNGVYVFIVIFSLIPLCYVVVLSIWWILVKKKLGKHITCFQQLVSGTPNVHLQEPCKTDEFPDRLQNPNLYEPQEASVLNNEEHKSFNDSKYGSISNEC